MLIPCVLFVFLSILGEQIYVFFQIYLLVVNNCRLNSKNTPGGTAVVTHNHH